EDIVQVHCADMRTLEPVEPVDLVISDFMGHFVIDDGMLEAVAAAQRWMKPTAVFAPSRVDMVLAPVADIHFRAREMWQERFFGLDLSAATKVSEFSFYLSQLRDHAVVAPPQPLASFAPPSVPDTIEGQFEFEFVASGVVQALAGWFTVQLA